jgi:hypothetical protein
MPDTWDHEAQCQGGTAARPLPGSALERPPGTGAPLTAARRRSRWPLDARMLEQGHPVGLGSIVRLVATMPREALRAAARDWLRSPQDTGCHFLALAPIE